MTQGVEKSLTDRAKFLIKNLLRGFLWLAVLLTAYFYVKNNYGFDLKTILGPLYDNWLAIYAIFLVSEVVFGIIPPEFFMFWALRHENIEFYILNVASLAVVSYLAGLIGYYIGSRFKENRWYRLLKIKIFGKFEKHFKRYGGFLIVVAALTPIPFSAVCMLMGAVKYNFKKFFWISLMRFARFIVYAIIIWQANILS